MTKMEVKTVLLYIQEVGGLVPVLFLTLMVCSNERERKGYLGFAGEIHLILFRLQQ